MSTEAAKPPPQANVSIESVLGVQQHTLWQRIVAAQAFWVTIALLIISVVMSWLQPASFATSENFYNITRNFSFIGIMALGMTAVIATGGIDLSVGSIMGLTAVASGLTLEAHYPAWAAIAVGLGAGALTGLINGLIIAYAGISPFVTTLGMLAIARSAAVVLSGNRMLYNFGPGGPAFKSLGGGALGLAAAFAAILSVGWEGSAINALGQSYELLAISAAVIGGANLMGGEASACGAFIGAALIFVIRNSLLMAGVDSNWQGTFVGLFLIAAVYLGKVRGARRE
jgi:ribose transport system permease protein